MTKFEIGIISDTVCPWCFIGYKRLQVAIAQPLSQNPADTFAIQWHPFQLDPKSPKGESIDKNTSYERKFGEDGAEMLRQRLRSAGKDAGIEFNFAGRTGNTLDSHRLIELAKEKGDATIDRNESSTNLQTRLVEELFADYFERGQDITSHEVLTKAAGRVGLDEDEICSFLTTESLARDVERMASDNRADGVSGVPYFNINDVFNVSGGQEPDAFIALFNRLKKREAATL